MSENIVDIRTVKTNVVKSIFEGLKNVVGQGNLFVNEEGIKFCQFNQKKRQIVYLYLSADKFEHYDVKSSVVLGVNVLSLYKILKLVGTNDIISLQYSETNSEKLVVRFDDEKQGLTKRFQLDLLTLEKIMMKPKSIQYDVVFTISSGALQKIAKDFHSLECKVIRITSIDDQVILSTHDSKTKAEVVIVAAEAFITNKDSHSLAFNKSNTLPIVGLYPLDAISFATKTININNTVTVYLSNESPLMISYQTALGDLRFIISCDSSKTNDAIID